MRHADVDVNGIRIAYREWGDPAAPVLLAVHGVPDGAFLWADLAEGVADLRRVVAPDLPGFGRSDAPPDFDHSVAGYGAALAGFVDALDISSFDLAVHDFSGSFGVGMAGRRPEALTGLLIFNTTSFTGWGWHPVARLWRTPLLGELSMAPVPRPVLRAALSVAYGGAPPERYVDGVWEGWRRWATRRAILRLYRNTTDEDFAYAQDVLPDLAGTPALVVWGDGDPFLPKRFADRYVEALDSDVVHLDAGHWPMIERADDVIAAVRPFLGDERSSRRRIRPQSAPTYAVPSRASEIGA